MSATSFDQIQHFVRQHTKIALIILIHPQERKNLDGAFVHARQILDGILTANECIHSRHRQDS